MKQIFKIAVCISLGLFSNSCNVLDREPLDKVSPENYYKTADQLSSFTIRLYDNLPNINGAWNAGMLTWDNGTDNQAGTYPNRTQFLPSEWKVPNEGSLGVNEIRNINYFLQTVNPKIKANEIWGAKADINHYLGEAYFFRAYLYFGKLKTYGDFPIITVPLIDEDAEILKHAKRMPRNEVARFILKDLDKAIELLKETTSMNQRLTKRVAHLFKSRVALYEATFEKYHKGSGRVPGDDKWPGKDKEWNQSKVFNQDEEVRFFLEQAMSSAKVVADAVELTPNNGVMNPTTTYNGWNPYYDLFASINPSGMPEALLWRQFSRELSMVHHTSQRISEGTASGWTRSLVESFLTTEGKPYYTVSSSRSDATIKEVKKDRDQRLQLFIFAEGDVLHMNNNSIVDKFKQASLLENNEIKDITGYRQRKFYNYHPEMRNNSRVDQTAMVIFRAAEAYLNYIEASYLLNNNLTSEARAYWEKLRVRAGIQANTIDATIAATDMSLEAKLDRPSYDWGAFSAAQAVDPTLYSIRRERRCELAGEGYRWDDLVRWRAMDQVKNYHIEGVNFWTTIHEYDYFKNKEKTATRIKSDGGEKSTLSSKDLSIYLQPYRVVKANNNMYDGYTFTQAHYLAPVSVQEMLYCSPDKTDPKKSYFYQNPGWQTTANTPALN